jgi:hypothetical protein
MAPCPQKMVTCKNGACNSDFTMRKTSCQPYPRSGHADCATCPSASGISEIFLFLCCIPNKQREDPSQRNRKRLGLKCIFRTVRVTLFPAPVPVAYSPLCAAHPKSCTFIKNTSSFETLGSMLFIPNISVEWLEFVFCIFGETRV